MMEYKLLKASDKRLRQKAKLVEDLASVRDLADYMVNRLIDSNCGLAATQFGEMVRLFVAKLQGLQIVLVNPEITKKVGTHTVKEGCLSLPGREFWVSRPKIVKIKGLTLEGKIRSVRGRDLLAQILCHEIDHLDGIMIDAIGREER